LIGQHCEAEEYGSLPGASPTSRRGTVEQRSCRDDIFRASYAREPEFCVDARHRSLNIPQQGVLRHEKYTRRWCPFSVRRADHGRYQLSISAATGQASSRRRQHPLPGALISDDLLAVFRAVI
jgi:hypothetical protein